MDILFAENEDVGVMITPDPFGGTCLWILVVTDNPERDFPPLKLPLEELIKFLEVMRATRQNRS